MLQVSEEPDSPKKVFGANIRCAVCDAQPFPDNPETTRETFDLLKVGDRWLCEQCRQKEECAVAAAEADT